MEPNVGLAVFLLTALFFLRALSQPISTPLFVSNQDYGNCDCDLNNNYCDLNCCCDTLCSSTDLSAFGCPTTSAGNVGKWCVPQSALFTQNTPYIINSLGGLLCIDLNNSLSMNFYQSPQTNNVQSITNYVNQLVLPTITSSDSVSFLTLNQKNAAYSATDRVWVYYSNNILGPFTLPSQTSAGCSSVPSVFYLKDSKSSCFQTATQIDAVCSGATTSSPLIASYYVNNFYVLKSPASLKSCYSAFNTNALPVNQFNFYSTCGPSNNQAFLVNAQLRKCTLANGQQQDCNSNAALLAPSLSGTTCSNLVKRAVYTFQYNNPTGIMNVFVDLEFFTSVSPYSQVTQNFEVYFLPNTAAIPDVLGSTILSGNPGYIVGAPILTGYSDGSKIIQNSDRFKRFTTLKPQSSGTCATDDSSRQSIFFGKNVRTECKYQSTINLNDPSDFAAYCATLQQTIFNILLGTSSSNRPNVFAPFATSPSNSWLSIVNSATPTQSVATVNADQLGGICNSLITSLSIQVAYANVGNVNNPQSQIQYIAYDWTNQNDLNVKCFQPSCPSLNLQNYAVNLKISTFVTFVDVSQGPAYTESQVTKPKVVLPGDFFYPFTLNSSNKAFFAPLILFLSLLASYLNLFR